MNLAALKEALRIEEHAEATDETKSARVRRGVYSLRGRPGYYMIRIRIPGGILTPHQLEAVAGLVQKSGWPSGAHLTTRQGIEIAGVAGRDVPEYLDRLDDAELTTLLTGGNAVRGIVCCPLSGVAADEAFDVTPYALAADRYFREHPELTRMPRKVKIAFESCAHDHVRTLATDIGLHAVRQGYRDGFRITVGGGLGATPKAAQVLEEFVPAEDWLAEIEAILRVFDRHGDRGNRARARLKWLLADWGIERFRETVHEERSRGEFSGSGAHPSPSRSFSSSASATEAISVDAGHAEDFARWLDTNVVAQKQPGLAAVFLRIPYGDVTAEQLLSAAEAATRFASGGIRLSIEQNFVLRGVRREVVPALYDFLRPAGLATCCAGQLIDVTRCVGSSACLSAITSSRAAAAKISEALDGDLARDPVLQGLRVRVSGCHNSCSHHHAADIGLFGISKKIHGRAVPHYALLAGGSAAGGRTGTRLIDMPAARVAEAVANTLRFFREERAGEESFSSFVERIGAMRLRERLAPLTDAPAPEADPAFYRDLDADADFKVESRRGECAY